MMDSAYPIRYAVVDAALLTLMQFPKVVWLTLLIHVVAPWWLSYCLLISRFYPRRPPSDDKKHLP